MFQPKICSVFRFHEKFDKKKYHNTKFSTPVYNVYPEDVVNPIFTNWKITSKKDVVGDLPSECEIRKGILFVNKNIFIFTRVTHSMCLIVQIKHILLNWKEISGRQILNK